MTRSVRTNERMNAEDGHNVFAETVGWRRHKLSRPLVKNMRWLKKTYVFAACTASFRNARMVTKTLLTMKIYTRVADVKTELCVVYCIYTLQCRSRRGRHKSFIRRTALRVVTRNTSPAIRSISSPTSPFVGTHMSDCVQSSIDHSCRR